MGRDLNGSITISTLGDYAEFGHMLSATCEGHGCGRRSLPVTLDDLIRIFGSDWPFVARKPPIRCTECGSRDISYTISSASDAGMTLGHSQ